MFRGEFATWVSQCHHSRRVTQPDVGPTWFFCVQWRTWFHTFTSFLSPFLLHSVQSYIRTLQSWRKPQDRRVTDMIKFLAMQENCNMTSPTTVSHVAGEEILSWAAKDESGHLAPLKISRRLKIFFNCINFLFQVPNFSIPKSLLRAKLQSISPLEFALWFVHQFATITKDSSEL